MRKFGISEFSTKPTNFYNLDVIISVGYRYIILQDVKIAKNYLTEKELHQLNLIVSLYLDFAELQATNGRLMKMKDWIVKLDDFLKLNNF